MGEVIWAMKLNTQSATYCCNWDLLSRFEITF